MLDGGTARLRPHNAIERIKIKQGQAGKEGGASRQKQDAGAEHVTRRTEAKKGQRRQRICANAQHTAEDGRFGCNARLGKQAMAQE